MYTSCSNENLQKFCNILQLMNPANKPKNSYAENFYWMKSEVMSSVAIDPMDGVYCYTPWGNLLEERKHSIIAEISLSIQMQQDLKEWEAIRCDRELNIHIWNVVFVTRHRFLTANTFKLKTTHDQKLHENKSKGVKNKINAINDLRHCKNPEKFMQWLVKVQCHCKSQQVF